jgi:hypothetical protein
MCITYRYTLPKLDRVVDFMYWSAVSVSVLFELIVFTCICRCFNKGTVVQESEKKVKEKMGEEDYNSSSSMNDVRATKKNQ